MTTDEALEVHESGKPINVEAGIYPGAVNAVEETVHPEYGKRWRFEFRLDGYPDEAPWAWASTKSGLGTKTKLYKWASALLGRPLAIGEKLTPTQLIDLPCNILIKEKPDIERDSGVRRYVDDILGVKKAKAKTDTPLADKCFCGKPVHSYSSTGAPLCEKHTAEAMQE